MNALLASINTLVAVRMKSFSKRPVMLLARILYGCGCVTSSQLLQQLGHKTRIRLEHLEWRAINRRRPRLLTVTRGWKQRLGALKACVHGPSSVICFSVSLRMEYPTCRLQGAPRYSVHWGALLWSKSLPWIEILWTGQRYPKRLPDIIELWR